MSVLSDRAKETKQKIMSGMDADGNFVREAPGEFL